MKTISNTILVTLFFFIIYLSTSATAANQDTVFSDGEDEKTDSGLFTNDPYVISLNERNLAANLFGQTEATVAMFYASWCGHCQHTAPIFSALAATMAPWRAAVKAVAINCANERYADRCLALGIVGYPTLVFSPPKAEEVADWAPLNEALYPVDGENDVASASKSASSTATATASLYAAVLQQLNRARRGVVQAILVASREEICASFGYAFSSPTPLEQGISGETKLYAIVEHEPTVTSAETILDLLNWRSVVRLKRFYDRTDSLAESLATIHVTLPAILEVSVDRCTFQPVMNSGQSMAALKNDFERRIWSKYPSPDPDHNSNRNLPIPNNNNNNKAKNATAKANQKVVRYRLSYIDLYNTMRTSILDEMLKVEPYEEHHVHAIKQYFSVVYRYFPFRNENVRRLFKRMNMWLDHHDVTNMNRVRLREAVKISDGFLWPAESYRFCNGSEPKYRGYPCGMWVLFHVLTVNEYLRPPQGGVKHEVLYMMRNYTSAFFSCKQCAAHFVAATREMAAELTTANASVLLLWRLHNQVNQRLEGDPFTEDPFHPKALFPGVRLCPACFSNGSSTSYGAIEAGGTGGQFELPAVLEFLTDFYAKKSISNSGYSVGVGGNPCFSVSYVWMLSLVALLRLVSTV